MDIFSPHKESRRFGPARSTIVLYFGIVVLAPGLFLVPRYFLSETKCASPQPGRNNDGTIISPSIPSAFLFPREAIPRLKMKQAGKHKAISARLVEKSRAQKKNDFDFLVQIIERLLAKYDIFLVVFCFPT